MKKNAFLFVILLLVFSCKRNEDSKPTNPVSDANQLRENSFLLDTNSVIAVDASKLSIAKSKADKKHVLGDIFLIPPFGKLPFGEMRRVTGVSETSADYVYETEPAALNEAFKKLSIADSTLPTLDTLINGRISDASLTFTFEKELAVGAKVKGIVKVNLTSRKWEYKLTEASQFPEKVLLQITLDTKGTEIEFEVPEEKSINSFGEVVLGKPLELPPITITIPIPTPIGVPFPFPLKFSQKITATTGPISLTGKMKYTLPGYVEARLGVKYENGTFIDLSGVTFASVDGSPQKCTDFSRSVTLAATLMKMQYELKPYNLDILSSTMGLGTKAEATIQSSSPNWALKTFQFIEGGIKTKFFTNEKNSFLIGGNIHFNEKSTSGDFREPCAQPNLTTLPVSSITSTSAVCGGNITNEGNSAVTARGICWSTSQNPTIVNSKTSDGSGSGSFTSNLTGLTANTTYYVRAYATNSAGTGYGNEVSFKTTQNSSQDTCWLTWDFPNEVIDQGVTSMYLRGYTPGGHDLLRIIYNRITITRSQNECGIGHGGNGVPVPTQFGVDVGFILGFKKRHQSYFVC